MIAREGIPFICIGLFLTVLLIIAATRTDSWIPFAFALLFGVLTLFTTYFFRDPNRQIPEGPGILVSPADGQILSIDTVNHPFVGDSALKISIFLNVFNVHVNRVPATGVIDYVKYNPGKFFAAFEDKASELNEQTEIGLTTSLGDKITFKQIAGLIARRIVCRLKAKDEVAAGDRFGLIRFGSRTELFLPKGSTIQVKKGDRVRGGSTVIGYLPMSVAKTTLKAGERHAD